MRWNSLIALVTLLALAGPAAQGRGADPIPPAPRAADAELDAWILSAMDGAHIPGLAAAIVREGALVWTGDYGLSRVRPGSPVGDETLFMLASVSKTVIAVAAMQAVEDGLLDLDADIGDVLPFEVVNPLAGPGEVITARMLLSHVSGIRDNWGVLGDLYVMGDSPIALGDFLEDYLSPGGAYYSAGLNYYEEGALGAFHYSNVGASLAAYLVEVVTGTPFDVYCEDHIFEPLGMDRTSFRLADLSAAEIAMPYVWKRAIGAYIPQGYYGYPDYPDGGLRTSARQLSRLLRVVVEGGSLDGTRILSAASVQELGRLQFPALEPTQGLIWYYKTLNGDTLLGHNGGDAGVTTEMFFRPRDGVGVILLLNGYGSARFDTLYDIEARLFEEAGGL